MKILKWHFFLSLVGMYVQNIMEIALCVLEFRHLVQNGALSKLWEPIVANQEGVYTI